jgi:hypothetical protein
MTQLRLTSQTLVATAALLLASLAPRIALAQSSCNDDSECEQGFECTVVGASGCAAAAPAPSCPPGESCELPEPQPCETVELKACTPAACTSDAQCAEGMVCHSWTQPCATSGCACSSDVPDCKCDPPPACEPEIASMCTPRYLLPCEQASDCGAGFTCEQQAAPCACAGGSAGTPTPGADAAAPSAPGFAPPPGAGGQPSSEPLPNPEPCVCEPSNVYVCVAQVIECTSDAACPAGWACQQEAQVDRPACGGDGCPEPEPLPAARSICQPAYYGGGGVAVGLPGVPGSDPAPTNGDVGTGDPESGDDEGGGQGDANESAACQFGRAPASSGALSLLVVLGALIGLKRRRSAQSQG